MLTVQKDLKELEIGENLEEIKNMKKYELSKILNEKAEVKALKDLNNAKAGHSKVMKLVHLKLQMRKIFATQSTQSNQRRKSISI